MASVFLRPGQTNAASPISPDYPADFFFQEPARAPWVRGSMTNLPSTAARAPGSSRVNVAVHRSGKFGVPPRRLTRVCAWCHRVQQADGSWQHTTAAHDSAHHISHGICPECVAALVTG